MILFNDCRHFLVFTSSYFIQIDDENDSSLSSNPSIDEDNILIFFFGDFPFLSKSRQFTKGSL